MTLKEKFENLDYFDSVDRFNSLSHDSDECEKIADDYAIEFAEWKDKLRPSQMVSFWSKNGEFKGKFDMDNEQLLEKFKKEKGL